MTYDGSSFEHGGQHGHASVTARGLLQSGGRLSRSVLRALGISSAVIVGVVGVACEQHERTQAAGQRSPSAAAVVDGLGIDTLSFSAPSREELSMVHAKLGLPPPTFIGLPPLTSCDVFRIDDVAPSYVGRIAEGDIAPYGILLMNKKSPKLVKRLLASQLDGLWEYSRGYGPTSADSALVIDGLLAAGVETSILVKSLDKIRTSYYLRERGAFVTVQEGRAAYWAGPSAGITAHIAYLMQRVAPERFRTEIASSARYVLKSQEPAGYWEGKWFPSSVMPTYYAIRFLVVAPGGITDQSRREAIRKATAFLARLQRRDGSMADSVIETALAVLSWRAANAEAEAAAKATVWLERKVKPVAPAGEPVLYYWFGDPGTGRVLFLCRDRGQLATAWAQMATRGPKRSR